MENKLKGGKKPSFGEADNFSELYPLIVDSLWDQPDQPSRNGATKELLNFTTSIGDPRKRLVGGGKRQINVFFLLAEAIWIWTGRNDVAFLARFNSKMKDFSDNGETFHAPYGFRLRHYGVESEVIQRNDSNKHANRGIDQILSCLMMLEKNPESRRVVASIWNSEFDLNSNSVDIPCNDLLMFKIREGKLHLTIQNRSNDIHWGLPTNVFQFSFLLEIMADLLGVEVGTQTHNSQSLHIYTDNPLAKRLKKDDTLSDLYNYNLYQSFPPTPMNLKFDEGRDLMDRLHIVDYWLNKMIKMLESPIVNMYDSKFEQGLKNFSPFFFEVFNLLRLYSGYTQTQRSDDDKMNSLIYLFDYLDLNKNTGVLNDYYCLAINWFWSKVKDKDNAIESCPSLVGKIKLYYKAGNL